MRAGFRRHVFRGAMRVAPPILDEVAPFQVLRVSVSVLGQCMY